MTWTLLVNSLWTNIFNIWTLCISKAVALLVATCGVHKLTVRNRNIMYTAVSIIPQYLGGVGGSQGGRLWVVHG